MLIVCTTAMCPLQHLSFSGARTECAYPQQHWLTAQPDSSLHVFSAGDAHRRSGRYATATTTTQPRQSLTIDRIALARRSAAPHNQPPSASSHAAARSGVDRTGDGRSFAPHSSQLTSTGKSILSCPVLLCVAECRESSRCSSHAA